VVTFCHDDRGTSEQQWQASGRLLALPLASVPAEPLVVVAAHPDDETLGAGGVLALAARAGVAIDVVVATDGEASHPTSPTRAPAELARWRADEVRRAVHLLAPRARLHLLHLPDGDLATGRDPLRHKLEALVGAGSCVVAPWRGDAHPDHEVAGDVAADVARRQGAGLLEYPVWAWHWAAPGDVRLPWARAVRVPLDAEAHDRKTRALREHRSQVEPLSALPGDEVLLSAAVLAHFDRDVEVFFATPAPGRAAPSLGSEYFDRFYAENGPDPWGFADRWYERRKRALTLAALPRERFRRAFEPGCSIGVLTTELADRCDHLLATDPSTDAVERARERLRGRAGVEVRRSAVPQHWPGGDFDLIVLSEVGYYCSAGDLARLVDLAARSLTDDGVLLACHWRHPVADYPLTGDAVHDALLDHPRLARLAGHVEEDFLLDVLVPAPAVSVARATGLLQ
jgi:LmbE family N-acetylglucosaminyl deacetylase/SAM-dependent methyltransferase